MTETTMAWAGRRPNAGTAGGSLPGWAAVVLAAVFGYRAGRDRSVG